MSLKTSEIQNVEFKEVWKDDYLKWISGFANAKEAKSTLDVMIMVM